MVKTMSYSAVRELIFQVNFTEQYLLDKNMVFFPFLRIYTQTPCNKNVAMVTYCRLYLTMPSVPKNVLRLINNRTKAFHLISEMFSVLDKGDPNLDLTSHFSHLDENCQSYAS